VAVCPIAALISGTAIAAPIAPVPFNIARRVIALESIRNSSRPE
jgi:hypothetical protein